MNYEQLSLLPVQEVEHLYQRLYRRLDPVLNDLGYGYVYVGNDARMMFAGLERRLVAALEDLRGMRKQAGAA